MARMRAIVLLVLVAACGGDGSRPAPTNPTPPSPPPPSPPTPPSVGDPMRVAVLLSTSRLPSADDVHRVFGRANDMLQQKTGERMSQVDLVTTGSGSAISQAQAYVNARADSPPDGVLAFSDDQTSTSFGGYSLTFPMPLFKVNQFPSPVVGEDRVYLAVVDFFHMYGRCGYDNSGNRVSSTSFGGECRNRSGLACLNNGRYWACPDSLNDLYADLDYFTACGVVHEFMHPFGREGNFDHYGTAQCISRTGMTQSDAQNLTLAQQSCGMCPDVYRNFKHR